MTYKLNYYITILYKPCNISPAVPNNRLAISISGPISHITAGTGRKCYFLLALFVRNLICKHLCDDFR